MHRSLAVLGAAAVLFVFAGCGGSHGISNGGDSAVPSAHSLPVSVQSQTSPVRYSITYIPLATGCGLVEAPYLASNGDVAVNEICGAYTDVLVYHGGATSHLASHFLYTNGINSSDHVVAQGEHSNFAIVDLVSGHSVWLEGKYPLARGINDKGFVVGDVSTCQNNSQCSHATRFAPDGTPTMLSPAYTKGMAINATGTVLGEGWDAQGNYRAFLFETGRTVLINSVIKQPSVVPAQLNDKNDALVLVGPPNTSSISTDLFTGTSTPTVIPPLSSNEVSLGASVNNLRQVVGNSCDSSLQNCRPYLYQNGSEWPLTTLAPGLVPGKFGVIAINNNGQILTSAVRMGQNVPALLIPQQ